jgi:hypothetical protein
MQCFYFGLLFCLLVSNILLRNLSSNVLSLYPSLKVKDKVTQAHNATDEILVLYILIFIFLEKRREDKRFWTER